MTQLTIIILAAGNGKRMHSSLPKVLHPLAGKPLLAHVIATAQTLNPQSIYIVYGYQGEQVRAAFSHLNLHWIEQTEQLGTGHAVAQVLPHLAADSKVLVLNGDVPLISASTLQTFMDTTPEKNLGLITAVLENPWGLGRILRDSKGRVKGIVEEKDADSQQRSIQEIYAGILFAAAPCFKMWIPRLNNHNAQKEYYLTELIELAAQENYPIADMQIPRIEEVLSVNDRAELARLERYCQQKIAQGLMNAGVTLMDPQRLDVRGNLTVGQDVIIDINVLIEGDVMIGNNCYIGPNTCLRNVRMGENVEIKANSIIEESDIGAGCRIGPFARIRPGTRLAAEVHIGNFVEVKNVQIGERSKANHHSYLGDAKIGKDVNIGAGTITCNYDGVKKYQTVIGDRAFIGSDTQLIAPVTVGPDAIIGAGSTITKDAPSEALTFNKKSQESIVGWQRRDRDKK